MIDPLDYSPWDFWTKADPQAKDRQRAHLAALGERETHEFGADAFVSELPPSPTSDSFWANARTSPQALT